MMVEYGTPQWFESMFDTADTGYDKWGHQWRGSQKYRYELYKKIFHTISIPINGIIMDIGCGMGNFTQIIKKSFPDTYVIGVDISRKAIQYSAKKYPENHYFMGALPDIPIKRNSCHFILCLDSLYYLNEDRRKKALENIASILQEEGVFLLSGGLDDGSRYFKESKIIDQISVSFDIISVTFNYSKLYVFFEKRLLNFISYIDFFHSFIHNGKFDKENKYSSVLQKINKFLHSVPNTIPIIEKLIYSIKKVIMTLLSWELPVRICYHISRIILGEKGKTQIIILARKKKFG